MSLPVVEGVGPQVNIFEQVSSDDHQMSQAGGAKSPMSHVLEGGWWYWGCLYSEVQYIMGNGTWGPPPCCGQTD